MPRAKAKVEQSLQVKGFRVKEGDHHYFTYYRPDGRKTSIFTKTSHTPKMREIPDNLLGMMAKQCKLSKKLFLDLVDCPMSREAYDAMQYPPASDTAVN
ncbi:MAG TPA: hypothetical protein PKO15_18090 [Fibrobacteria bacterium]|nr:hypothetical protein [Fibrobacteria bacterium]HOX51452.1 hypothetical protein [Fibrobacteria bacterium]